MISLNLRDFSAVAILIAATACGNVVADFDGGPSHDTDANVSGDNGGFDGGPDAGGGLDGSVVFDGGGTDGAECRVDADCDARQYCRFDGFLCPDSFKNFTIPIPGQCVTPACGERRCEGKTCANSDDCAPEEGCGIFTANTCEYRGNCLRIVECNDPGCSVVWVPGENCDYCLCDVCPGTSDAGSTDDGGSLDGGPDDSGLDGGALDAGSADAG